jgi:hypothetical protein
MSARLQDNRVATTAVNQHWQSPRGLIARISKWRTIALDPCSNVNSETGAKVHFRGPGHVDGLKANWREHVGAGEIAYVNNPYEDNDEWFAKCDAESTMNTDHGGVPIVQLVPNRSDTIHWHRHVRRATYIVNIAGRMSYGGLSRMQLRAVGILQKRFCEERNLTMAAVEKDKELKKMLEVQEKILVNKLMVSGPPPEKGEDVFDASGTAKFPSVCILWGPFGGMLEQREIVKVFGEPGFGFVTQICLGQQ